MNKYISIVDCECDTYATFHSHNQRIVSLSNGSMLCCILYRAADNHEETWSQWKLYLSEDRGEKWQETFSSKTHSAIRTPCIESSGHSIYVVHADAGNLRVSRFHSAHFCGHIEEALVLPGADAGKFSTYFDPKRNTLFIFTFHGNGVNFYILPCETDGAFKDNRAPDLNWPDDLENLTTNCAARLIVNTDMATDTDLVDKTQYLQYPHLVCSGDDLIVSWTNVNYYPIKGHANARVSKYSTSFSMKLDLDIMQLKDMYNRPIVNRPVQSNPGPDDGEATEVTLPGENRMTFWLSNICPSSNFVHYLLYSAQYLSNLRYLRIHKKTGHKEVIWSTPGPLQLKGLTITQLCGMWCVHCVLYTLVITTDVDLALLVSSNEGADWEVAESQILGDTFDPSLYSSLYAPSGSRNPLKFGDDVQISFVVSAVRKNASASTTSDVFNVNFRLPPSDETDENAECTSSSEEELSVSSVETLPCTLPCSPRPRQVVFEMKASGTCCVMA